MDLKIDSQGSATTPTTEPSTNQITAATLQPEQTPAPAKKSGNAKIITAIIAALLIIGIGVYFAFFAPGPKTVNQTHNQDTVATTAGQNTGTPSDQANTQGSPNNQNPNNTNSGATGSTLTSCDNLIPLDQVKKIIGDSGMRLTSSLNNSDNNLSSTTAVVSCSYTNFDIRNSQTIPSTMITVSVSIFNYSQSNLDFLKSNNGFNMTPITNVGSQAFQYYADKTLTIMPAYLVISTNQKYIIVMFDTIVTRPSNPAQGINPSYDATKENQTELAIIKTVNTNLNNY